MLMKPGYCCQSDIRSILSGGSQLTFHYTIYIPLVSFRRRKGVYLENVPGRINMPGEINKTLDTPLSSLKFSKTEIFFQISS